jgi:segregation and condensation protein A
MNYQVKLEVFEGPFDLLLHLIERNQLNIYDIPIAIVADQFFEYIQTMQLLNLTIAGEFLVVAATLMQIKARMLLPKPPVEEMDEADDSDEEDDPRRELVERLLEYKRFKEAAVELRQREEEWGRRYPRIGGEFPDQIITPLADPTGGISVWDLMEAFRTVLDSITPRPEVRGMPREEISVRERMNQIISRLRLHGKLPFTDLFEGMVSKKGLITTFLALLELIRIRKVNAFQERTFGEISIAIFEEGEAVEPH